MSILTCHARSFICFKAGRLVTIKIFLIQVNNDSIRYVIIVIDG